jgi:hypothetical protein
MEKCGICDKIVLPGDAVVLHKPRSTGTAHMRCVENDEDYGFCRACKEAFHVSKLNSKSLCEEHSDEFDLDQDEQDDLDDLIENITKDG